MLWSLRYPRYLTSASKENVEVMAYRAATVGRFLVGQQLL
jgi:hypothetical protein